MINSTIKKMKKGLLIKDKSIHVFLYSIKAINKNGIPFTVKGDIHETTPNLGELFYAKISETIHEGVKITFEFDDKGCVNGREFINRRVYVAKQYDSHQVMFVFEGDNISDPLEL